MASPKFQWSIDELALLKPADIELPHPDAWFSGSVHCVYHTHGRTVHRGIKAMTHQIHFFNVMEKIASEVTICRWSFEVTSHSNSRIIMVCFY